jgi:septal ring factor EnvC (AmiA/AmiB activator)
MLGVAWLLAAVAVPTLAQDEQARALETVRREIKALESRLTREHGDRDSTSQALRRTELEMAALQEQVTALRAQHRAELARQRELAAEATEARGRLGAEQDVLAQQVRLSFMTGREPLFKLLLSQKDPARLGRMLVYYDYFNRARSERIAGVNTELESLRALELESAANERRLADVEQRQATQLGKLAEARDARKAVLGKLDTSIADADQKVARLRSEETRLTALLEELRRALEDFPVNSDQPFTAQRGQLAWPTTGRIVGDWGRSRVGSTLTWNGVLIEAEAGTPVRAVYHGRIAFADWLNGLGLLVIVDHGDGYMSLYGHNQALLKESGDWVAPGETIAEMGDSGGQPRAGLYFEIRRNGQPVNPHGWLRGSPRPR